MRKGGPIDSINQSIEPVVQSTRRVTDGSARVCGYDDQQQNTMRFRHQHSQILSRYNCTLSQAVLAGILASLSHSHKYETWAGWHGGLQVGRSAAEVDRRPTVDRHDRHRLTDRRSQKKQRRQRKTTTWRYMYMYTYLFAAGVGFGTPSSRRQLSF